MSKGLISELDWTIVLGQVGNRWHNNQRHKYMATSIISNIDRNYFEAAFNQNSGNTLSKVSFYRTQATTAGGNIIAVWSRSQQTQYLCLGIWNANGFSSLINNGGFTLNSVSTSVLSINVPSAAGNIALFSVGRPVHDATFT